MDFRTYRADALLLLTALIWGAAFVAQRVGMDHVGPMTFNGVRFALGALALLPLILKQGQPFVNPAFRGRVGTWLPLTGSLVLGLILFCAASLQQIGLVYTTAGKAGFITGLYVVIVPFLGLFIGFRPDLGTWIGAVLAVAGMYLLSVTEGLTLAYGDLLVFIGSFLWAGHVLVIGWLAPRLDPLRLSCGQFIVCAVASLIAAALTEPITLDGLRGATPAILYGGLMSVGVAYTLQVVAQKDAPPAHAAIILSLETVFAALAGWLLLNETMNGRAITGCVFMFAGFIIAQIWPMLVRKTA